MKNALTLARRSKTGPIPYPIYEVLTANGVTEVVEHRRMEPVFYITDDPDVRRKLGVPEESAAPSRRPVF